VIRVPLQLVEACAQSLPLMCFAVFGSWFSSKPFLRDGTHNQNVGRKIGIAWVATPDFDLVCANAEAVENFCDQFESIELTRKECFYFMQLIVASLDEALLRGVPSARESEQRVEQLIVRNIPDNEYIGPRSKFLSDQRSCYRPRVRPW
jgi:hypothetical protein